MARRFFRKYMPSPDRVRNPRLERIFGKVLHQPNLWHLNRDSVSRAFAIGLFWAMVPMPFQMIPAVFCAIKFRANLGLSLALVWISNPLTMGLIMFAQYWLGRMVLRMRPAPDEQRLFRQIADWSNWMDLNWLGHTLGTIGGPLYLGAAMTAILVSGLGYLTIQLLWRGHTRRRWRRRVRISKLAAAMHIEQT